MIISGVWGCSHDVYNWPNISGSSQALPFVRGCGETGRFSKEETCCGSTIVWIKRLVMLPKQSPGLCDIDFSLIVIAKQLYYEDLPAEDRKTSIFPQEFEV